MKYLYLLTSILFFSSCVAVRFPNELTVNVTVPEHMPPHEVHHAIMEPLMHIASDSILKLPMNGVFWKDINENTFEVLSDSLHGPHKSVKIMRMNGKKGAHKDMKVIVRINKDSLSIDEN